jgi:N utilization substance protein B
MQTLFEDDLTHHGMADILQHIGEHARREHRAYYARIQGDTRKAVVDIGFLARNPDTESSREALSHFQEATAKLLGSVFEVPESVESEAAEEYLSPDRTRLESTLKKALSTYRASAGKYLEQEMADGNRDGASEANARALEAETSRQLEITIEREERASRDTLMDMMRRAERLVRGVESNQAEIDPHIEKAAPAFPMPQLASIDRVVLRLAVYELLFEPDVPFKVAINEAVEIAKRYGGPKSGSFVNGVLRTISETLPASRKTNQPAP